MPWFYYSGQTPTPIAVGDGEVKSVPPHSKVEIDQNSANDAKIRNLMARKLLKRCGPPPTPTQPKVKVEAGPPKTPDPEDKLAKAIVNEKRAKKSEEGGKVAASGEDGVKGESVTPAAETPAPPRRRRRRSSSSSD